MPLRLTLKSGLAEGLLLFLVSFALMGLCLFFAATTLLQETYQFPAFSLAAWRALQIRFWAGEALPLGLVAIPTGALLCQLLGTAALLAYLRSLASHVPAVADMLAICGLVLMPSKRKRRPGRRVGRSIQTAESGPGRSSPSCEDPASPAQMPGSADAALESGGRDLDTRDALSRIVALYEVWTEPPAQWMEDCLADEAAKLAPEGWRLLLEMTGLAEALARWLSQRNILPGLPEFRDLLAAPATVMPDHERVSAARLSVGAAWLCESLDNLLTVLPDACPKRLFALEGSSEEAMLLRALKAMTSADWHSLDLFPEKASKTRLLTDRFAAQVRQLQEHPVPSVARHLEKLLAQIDDLTTTRIEEGMVFCESAQSSWLVQALDLQSRHWILPADTRSAWKALDGTTQDPVRQFRRKAARWALRQGRSMPQTLVLALDHGSIETTSEQARQTPEADDMAPVLLAWLAPKQANQMALQNLIAPSAAVGAPLNARSAMARHA